jgi:carbon storage regulator CsrA
MLVLSLRKGQAIVLGPHEDQLLVRVTVFGIRGPIVRLMCESPRHLLAFRAEIANCPEAWAVAEDSPQGGAAPVDNGSITGRDCVVLSRRLNERILFGQAAVVTVVGIDKDRVRLVIEAPSDWFICNEELLKYYLESRGASRTTSRESRRTRSTRAAAARSAAAPAPSSREPQKAQSTEVAEILSRAGGLGAPEQLEELTAGLLALRAKRLAPVASEEETELLLSINEGVPAELTDRAASLIEKRDSSSLTVEESGELLQLADEVERRGVERLEALSRLAELRGVSLRDLMQTLGVTARDHG